MIGIEIAAVGVVVYIVTKQRQKKAGLPGSSKYCSRGADTVTEFQDNSQVTSVEVRRKLLELSDKTKQQQELDTDDSSSEESLQEEEIFGSGVWGVDFHHVKYTNERVLNVSLYEETIKPRSFFPIIHPYILVETPSWTYVLEKWRDGIAVSRFKHRENAIRSRGKWFGQGRLSQRRLPHLVEKKSIAPVEELQLGTTDLLVWSIEHPYFKQYTDNCHTFAANLCKKVKMKNPNHPLEELVYENY
eukprot:NODE_299_length_998_cov_446.365098_g292_i0.p1 GENE.NODE_299_length_998_cov_446.365098_g292_i0~~NODE_299_length_998_cov_446.365098_g292_i0.p1  ORF type:complete len:245 (-),score=42.68 NODE_299_length_998_cov_446.365098_g292_i0:164-898(-)